MSIDDELDFIKLASLHFQEGADGNVCTQSRDDDAKEEHHARRDGQHVPRGDAHNFGIVAVEGIEAAGQHQVGNDGSQEADGHGPHHKGSADEAPRRSHQLHGVDGEAACVDAQAHGVVDERERDQREQHGQEQQAEAYLGQVAVDHLDESLLVVHLRHLWHLLQFLGYPRQRVVVGVGGAHGQFYGRLVGVLAVGELGGVDAHFLGRLGQGLLLAHILDLLDIRPLGQCLAHSLSLGRGHVMLKHHGHDKILLYRIGKVASREAKEHDDAKKNEHQRYADAQCDGLQARPLADLIPFISHSD